MKKQSAIFAAIFAVVLASMSMNAQQTAAPPTARVSAYAPAERLTNLDTLKDQLKQYHECSCKCGCYAKDLDRQADVAIAVLRARVARRKTGEKLALVLDIDETTLSNYEEMVKADFAYNKNAFDAWVQSAKAPAIPGTLRLYREAQRLGVSVFFITGRPEAERAATEQNLRAESLLDWQQLYLRSTEQESVKMEVYKSSMRAAIAAQGYRIVLNVGDQWSDRRGTPEAELFVKYPDPYYFIP